MSAAFHYITEFAWVAKIAQEIREAETVALDLETTSLDPRMGRIRLLSLNTGKGVYVLDLWALESIAPILEALDNPTRATGQGRPIVIGQNLAFDQKWLYHYYKLELWPVFDTYRASVLIYNGKVGPDGKDLRHDLFTLYERELKMRPQVDDLAKSNWSATPLTEVQKEYAADDVTHLPKLRTVLREKLVRLGLVRAAGIEFGVLLPEVSVELNGFALDRERWSELALKYTVKATGLKDLLQRDLPSPSKQLGLFGFDPKFKLTSPDQLLKSLRQIKGLEGLAGTAEEDLAPRAAEFPILASVLDYREAERFGTGFGEKYFTHLHPKTGRIHATYRGTLKAGRYSHTKPNLGAIPRGEEHRRCFRAPPGRRLVLADYTNIEMVAAAEIAEEEHLRQLFIAGKDAHKYLGAKIAGCAESALTKAQRQQAKPCIAEGQLVLTPRGLVPIEKVTLQDRVWDGIGWVTHEGVVYKGYREVMTYDGLTATLDHVVYLDDGRTVPFRTAASPLEGRRLARSGDGAVPLRVPFNDGAGGAARAQAGEVRRVRVLGVQEALPHLPLQHPHGEDYQLPLSARGEVRGGPASSGPRGAVRRDGAALHQPEERCLPELRGSRDRAQVRFEGALHPMDAGDPPARDLRGGSDRSKGQRRSLRAGESAAGDTGGESAEQAHEPQGDVSRTGSASHARLAPHEDGQPRVPPGVGADDSSDSGGRNARRAPVAGASAGAVFAHVYDIVNAGPRHRFTVSNRLACNCNFGFLYGMGWEKFILYAYLSYGVLFTPAQARAVRQIFFDAYPRFKPWHQEMVKFAQEEGLVRTPSGRLRWMPSDAYSEALNTPVQGAGADGLKIALREVFDWSKTHGQSKVYPDLPRVAIVHHVHDEIILEVDHEPELVAESREMLEKKMVSGMSKIIRTIPPRADPADGDDWSAKA